MSDPYLGEIRMFAGSFAPLGWSDCDGSLMSVSANPDLFKLLGTRFGGDGSTTFALPDLRGRVPIHQGAGNGLTPRMVGQQFGEETATVTTAQLPSHAHNWQATTDPASGATPIDATLATTTSPYYTSDATKLVAMNAESLINQGGGQAHSNVMPTQCIRFIIAIVGLVPQPS